MAKSKQKTMSNTIVVNKKATHDFFIEQRFEAGLQLQGWEVKSIRDSRVQLRESYVIIKHGEAWLIGVHITPLASASTHIQPDPTRTRKLLMHRQEINKLIGFVERKGYALVATKLYWKKGHIKLEIATAKGKKQHDKRSSEKEKDWKIEKQRLLKNQ